MSFVKNVKKLEDCIDGSMIYDIVLRHPIDLPFISFLQTRAQLDYYPDFPRPLFRGEISGLSQITGCLGADSFRAVLYRNDPERNLSQLIDMLEGFRSELG